MRTRLAVLFSLSLSVVGCGGDDTTGSTGTSGTSAGGQGGSASAGGGSGGSGGNQSSTAGSAGAGVGGSTGGGGGGMTTNDAGGVLDSGLPVDASGGSDSGTAMVACGTERPNIAGINGSEGLVIGADGAIYFSQARAVGRLRPGAASQPEKGWA